jgi:hypothetical protein
MHYYPESSVSELGITQRFKEGLKRGHLSKNLMERSSLKVGKNLITTPGYSLIPRAYQPMKLKMSG